MKIAAFSHHQVLTVILSVVVLVSLACGLTGNEAPMKEPTQVSSATAIPAQSEPVLLGEGNNQIALGQGGDIYMATIGGEGFRPLSGNLIMMALEEDQGVRLLIGNDGIPRWDLTWSPDGNQLAFVSESGDGDGYEIFVVDADGNNVRRLTHENHHNSSPAWSPDGSQIAFVDDSTIYVMETNGSNVRRLAREFWNGDPAWSPDGSQIAFVSDRDDAGYEIYVMDIAGGTDAFRLTENDIWEKNLAWSPDGSRIAFETFDPEQNTDRDIYVLQLESGVLHRLTDDGAFNTSPTWSPDSSLIAFSSKRGGGQDVYVMEADGSNVLPLTSDDIGVESLAWRPDRDRVVVAMANFPIPEPVPTPEPRKAFDCTAYTSGNGLPDERVSAIAVAPDGALWVGTAGNAIELSRFDGKDWHTYTVDDGLYPHMYFDIAVAHDGALWATTAWGAFRFDGRTSTTYDNEAVQLITVAPDGAVWIGSGRLDTDRSSISRFDGDGWTKYYILDDIENTGFDTIAVAFDGSVWMAGTESGDGGPIDRLVRFDGETWTQYTTADGLADDAVFSIAATSDGAVWFGTGDGGVSRFNGETWTTYTEGLPRVDAELADPPLAPVTNLVVAPDGTLWAGTWFGIARFDGESWTSYTTNNGLPSNRIHLMAAVPDGTLWIGFYDNIESRLADGISHCTFTP
jgi:Tol biopolymer transport system component/streptogramin lyase